MNEIYDPPDAMIIYDSASYSEYEPGFMKHTTPKTYEGFTLDSEDGCHIQVLAEISTREVR